MVYWSLVLLWWPVHIGRKIRPRKFFYIDFDGQKCDFFCFLENMAKLCRMVNIDFLGDFQGTKDQFSAKWHILGHYVTKYGFLKNFIFGDFWWLSWVLGGIQIIICFVTIKDLPIWFFGNEGILVSQISYGYKMLWSSISSDFFCLRESLSKVDQKWL